MLDKELLENFQLRAARTVTGAKKGTRHALLHEETCWPTLSTRRQQSKLMFMHSIVHNYAPDYLVELLPNTVSQNVSYSLRNRDNICQYKTRTERFRRSIIPDCIRLWNSTSNNLRQITDRKLFKQHVENKCVPNPLYYIGDRMLNVIHSQLRLKCSNLKAHLFSLHVISDPVCICNAGRETCDHFFFHCSLFDAERCTLMEKVSRMCKPTTQVFLYGDYNASFETNCKIILAVQNYIKETKRFN